MEVDGKKVSKDFLEHLHKHYTPFLSDSIRAIHAYGFVPWRLRKLSTGDPVPEVIPMGSFLWTTEPCASGESRYGRNSNNNNNNNNSKWRIASDNKTRSITNTTVRQTDYRDSTHADKNNTHNRRHRNHAKKKHNEGSQKNGSDKKTKEAVGYSDDDDDDDVSDNVQKGGTDERIIAKGGKRRMDALPNILYERQKRAMLMHPDPADDEESRLLRYRIQFLQNLGIHEDDVEIHNHVAPNNNICAMSAINGTVSSPMAHLITDYQNIRQAQVHLSLSLSLINQCLPK